ncbi:hypothetical protein SDC9_42624 [bioreactor metagenome]|jgi:hypothetical protein|uniref:IPT/TIG domain-containing protein n=1 Tax=bioreactor metagenome TaxID=1076179 RepID=A0A644VY92_9ZZZZ|nr:IPT/TIG domain-containing protein [Paludibacter sp.]
MRSKIILSFILVFLYACQETFLPPLIITGLVSDVDQEGAVFHAKITSLGNREINSFGFVWDTIPFPTIESAYSYKFHQPAELGNFQAKVSSALIRDKTYYVRAFIQNTETTTYGEEVSFVSMGGKEPEITGIQPLLGNINDTLVVIGRYFGTKNPIVKINQFVARVLRASQDSIHVIVPPELKEKVSTVKIENLNQIITAKDSFTLISPEIHAIGTKIGFYGDEIVIKGKNFSANPSSLKVFFHVTPSVFEYVDDQTITAVVPEGLDSANCSIGVVMNNQLAESQEQFSVLPVEIEDFSPKVICTGETMIIKGRNFNPIVDKNRVYVGGVHVRTLSVSETTLTVSLPKQNEVRYDSRNAAVRVNVGGNVRTFEEKLVINDKWFRLADAPLELRNENKICATCPSSYYYNYAHSFVVGKTAYIGLNGRQNFWAYDIEQNTWRKLADFPGAVRMSAAGFVYGNKIYYGTGSDALNSSLLLNDWWEYDTTTDSWVRKADFIGGGRSKLNGYSNTSGCFLAYGFNWNQYNGYEAYVWKYNPETDVWAREDIDVKGLQKSARWWMAESVNDEILVGYLNSLYDSNYSFYIFNTNLKTFSPIANFPYHNTWGNPNLMVLNNTIYIQASDYSESSKNFYRYDRTTNTWKFTETNIYTDITYGIAFEAGDVGYAGLGTLNHLYEFDPNR